MADTPTMLALAAVAALAGLVRGFAGFGAAMTFVPVAATIVGPQTAVVLLFLLDLLPSWALVPGVRKYCSWREVLPLALGAGITIPVGAYLLVSIDPLALRWAMPILSLIAVGFLASGWRYGRAPGHALSGLVGTVTGFLGGLTGFFGPPIVLFWLGGPSRASRVRANLIVFFAFTVIVGGLSYAANGLLGRQRIIEAALIFPVYGIAIWLGVHLFGRASEVVFRRIAYALIALAALVSLPVWK